MLSWLTLYSSNVEIKKKLDTNVKIRLELHKDQQASYTPARFPNPIFARTFMMATILGTLCMIAIYD